MILQGIHSLITGKKSLLFLEIFFVWSFCNSCDNVRFAFSSIILHNKLLKFPNPFERVYQLVVFLLRLNLHRMNGLSYNL